MKKFDDYLLKIQNKNSELYNEMDPGGLPYLSLVSTGVSVLLFLLGKAIKKDLDESELKEDIDESELSKFPELQGLIDTVPPKTDNLEKLYNTNTEFKNQLDSLKNNKTFITKAKNFIKSKIKNFF